MRHGAQPEELVVLGDRGIMRITLKECVRTTAACLLLLSAAACNRLQPAYNVQDHALPAQAQKKPFDEVSAAIAEAAQSAGWQVEPLGPGQMRATQRWREHAAIVLITYTDRTFSIRNDGSTNLLAAGDMIHREYNLRVHKLESAIELRLQKD
jgi:hypothetical protein